MEILRTTDGQSDLPRYFAQVFRIASELRNGRLDFVLRDGRRFRAEGRGAGPVGEIHVHDDDIFARLIREGDLGFSEAYLEGGWSSPDLQAFMDLIHADNQSVYDGFPGMVFVRAYERLRHLLRANSRRQAKRNISYHYDLGNDFYALWLDQSMTYSSALFRTGQESLEAAQRQKYAALVDRMGVRPGDHVLEIGCGWGGFAEYAAKERGLKVTGLTISKEQLDYAKARIARAGLSDRVDLKLQDYRDERGSYDGIASIEMFEAVGEKYWPVYFDTVRDRLKPGRNATLQIITLQEKRFEIYRKGVDFIQKYIFPGGMLPSLVGLAGRDQPRGPRPRWVVRVRRELQPDAAPLARGLQRPLGRGRLARLRYAVPADVEFLSHLLRRRLSRRKLRRNADHGNEASSLVPTAAKLFAAFAFAVLAFFTAEIFKPHMPEGTQFGYFSFVSALIGLVAGWRVMGPEAGRGNWQAVNSGLKTSAVMVGLALVIFSTYEMFLLAFRPAYEGPMEAIVGIFDLAVDFLLRMIAWDVILGPHRRRGAGGASVGMGGAALEIGL